MKLMTVSLGDIKNKCKEGKYQEALRLIENAERERERERERAIFVPRYWCGKGAVFN
jgi:hypothetical protein